MSETEKIEKPEKEADHHPYYRPRDAAVAAKYASQYPELKLVTIADFGGWPKVQKEQFADGAIFDQIYAH